MGGLVHKQEAKGQANCKWWSRVSRSGLSQPLIRWSAANNAVFTCIVVDNSANNTTSNVADIAVSLRRSIYAECSHPDQGICKCHQPPTSGSGRQTSGEKMSQSQGGL